MLGFRTVRATSARYIATAPAPSARHIATVLASGCILCNIVLRSPMNRSPRIVSTVRTRRSLSQGRHNEPRLYLDNSTRLIRRAWGLIDTEQDGYSYFSAT